jgi:phosphatidylglycerol phospholipase C
MVWTVNDPAQMMEAVRWEVDAILTDVTKTWIDLRAALRSTLLQLARSYSYHSHDLFSADYDRIGAQYSRAFLWTTLSFYTPVVVAYGHIARLALENIAGPFDAVRV